MHMNPQACLSIIAYRPKPDQEAELLSLAQTHVPYLRSLGLATERPHIVAQSADGVIVEVFEWSEGGLERAHTHPGVAELWNRFMNACDYVPLNTLPETATIFAMFAPLPS